MTNLQEVEGGPRFAEKANLTRRISCPMNEDPALNRDYTVCPPIRPLLSPGTGGDRISCVERGGHCAAQTRLVAWRSVAPERLRGDLSVSEAGYRGRSHQRESILWQNEDFTLIQTGRGGCRWRPKAQILVQ